MIKPYDYLPTIIEIELPIWLFNRYKGKLLHGEANIFWFMYYWNILADLGDLFLQKKDLKKTKRRRKCMTNMNMGLELAKENILGSDYYRKLLYTEYKQQRITKTHKKALDYLQKYYHLSNRQSVAQLIRWQQLKEKNT